MVLNYQYVIVAGKLATHLFCAWPAAIVLGQARNFNLPDVEATVWSNVHSLQQH